MRGSFLPTLVVSLVAGACVEVPDFPDVEYDTDPAEGLEPGENCSPGELDCICRPDDTCKDGLVCGADEICVTDDAGESSGDGDGDGDQNYIFVTSSTHAGDLGGLDGADAFCQGLAEEAGFAGVYIALLSDQFETVHERLAGSSGWIRPDGRPVAADRDQLVLGDGPSYPVILDENAQTVIPSAVWTGATLDGLNEGGALCDDWNTDVESLGGTGLSHSGGPRFFVDNELDCGASAHMYCAGINGDFDVTVPDPGAVRRAFVSNNTVPGDVDLAGLDTQCTNEAADAQLAGSFVALVSNGDGAPADRLEFVGLPWARVDDVLLSEAPNDLLDANYLAPLDVDAFGNKQVGPVWTGAKFPASPGTPETTCEQWKNAKVGVTGMFGDADLLHTQWSDAQQECALEAAVFCFEK